MLYPTDATWTEWAVTDELHKTVLLAWSEMFEEQTPDAWQVRTSTVKSIVQEIAHVSDVAQEYKPFEANLAPLIEEARALVAVDPVLPKRLPHLDRYFGSDKVKPETAHSLAAILWEPLEGYQLALAAELRSLLATPGSNEKTLALHVSLLLGTELAGTGYSLPFLREAGRSLMDASLPFPERFDALVGRMSGKTEHFKVSFIVHWPTFLARLRPNLDSLSMTEGPPPGPLEATEQKFFTGITRRDVVAQVDVEALDPFHARRLAEGSLARAFAALCLHQPQARTGLSNRKALVVGRTSGARVVEPDRSRYAHIQNLRKVHDKIDGLFAVERALPRGDASRLMGAIELYRTALSAETDEGRLINMWIALESIVRRSGGRIIDRICDWIPPMVALQYVRKHTRSLGRYIREFWRDADLEPFRPLFPKANRGLLPDTDLLDVILEPKDGLRVNALFTLIAQHPLLKFRLLRACELFSRPKNLAGAMARHRQNVAWQLLRIYRARNLVAHRAEAPRSLRHLLQHLQTYVLLTIQGLVTDMSARPTWGIDDVFVQRALLFEYYVSLLAQNPQPRIRDVVVLEPRDLTAR